MKVKKLKSCLLQVLFGALRVETLYSICNDVVQQIGTSAANCKVIQSFVCVCVGGGGMVCAPVQRDNPRALVRGLSTVQVLKPCSISLVP